MVYQINWQRQLTVIFGTTHTATTIVIFAFFLGFSVKLIYRVKTDNLPLKVKIKKAGDSLIGAKTLEGLKQRKGDQGDERSLSL